jgi:PST family polysaccharide transporter
MADVSVPPDSDAPPRDLGQRVSRGLGWSLLGQILSRFGTFASGIVLARLLAPIDFGEVAAALVVVNVVLSVNELGVIPAIVRWKGDVKTATSTATTIALVNSALMYGVAFFAAPAVAHLTNTPGSTWVIRIMALTVLVDGVVAVPLALLYRQLRTVPQVTAEVVGIVAYIVVAVGLASAGLDANAVAWGRVVGAAATAAVMIGVSPWPSRPDFDLGIARQLLRFGLPLALSTAVFEGVMNVDYLIVGRELAGASLGVYLLAFNLSNWPVSIVSTAIGRVSFAGYSALRHDRDRLAAGFVHSVAVALSAVVPLVLVLAVLAPDVVRVVYGSVWAEAAAPVRWLVVLGGVRVLLQLAGEVIAVVGRTMSVLYIRLLWLLALPPLLNVGAERGGLSGVAMAHVGVALAVAVPCFAFELRRIGIGLHDLAQTAVRPLLAGGAALVMMLALRSSVDGALGEVVVIGAVGGLTYLAFLLPANDTVTRTWAQLRGAGVGQ